MSIFLHSPPPLPSWAEILVFDVGNTIYTVNTSQYYLYVNTNGQDVTITLPSNAEASRAFNIRKINDSADTLTLITDNVDCVIDGNTGVSTNSILTSFSVCMGLDGNYWSTGGGGGGEADLIYYVNTAQLSANLTVYPLTSFLTSNYSNTTQLSANLGNYPNNSQLSSNIANFITGAQLSGNLTVYVNTSQLSSNLTNYPNNSQLSSNIGNFITGAQLSGNLTSYATNTYLTANYPNNSQLSSNLGVYVNTVQLSDNLSLYTNTLNLSANYPNTTQLTNNLANYPNTTQLSNNLANLPVFGTSTNGIVTNSGGGTTNYLRADGLWTAPSFAVVAAGNTTQVQYNVSNSLSADANFAYDVATTKLTVGNATVNAVFTPTAIIIGNASVNATINSTTFSGIVLIANNSSYLGTVAAAFYQQTGSPLVNNVATMSANNSSYLGTVAAASYINTSGSYVITGFHTYGNLTINVVVTNTSVAIGAINTSAVGVLLSNNLITVGNSSVNATVNSTTFSGTANDASYIGGLIASNVVSNVQLSANLSPLQPNSSGGLLSNSSGLFVNVNTGLSVNSLGLFSTIYSFRNRIINGDMKIDQKNVGAQQIITTSGAYTCDRWVVAPTGNSVAGRRTSNSSGWFYTITGNTSVTACDFKQRLEGNNVIDLIGTSVTLSAKISSTTLSSITWNAFYPNNALDAWSTSANNINFANGSITINSTPTVYTVTFTVNSSCSNGLQVSYSTGSFTSGNLTFTDIQLESGLVATPFERKQVGTELVACQRYYCKSYTDTVVPGTSVTTGTGGIIFTPSGSASCGLPVKTPVTMRKIPTVTIYDNSGTTNKVSYFDGALWQNGGTISASNFTDSIIYIQTSSSGISISFDFTANAEIY